jgi:hypothetical protein
MRVSSRSLFIESEKGSQLMDQHHPSGPQPSSGPPSSGPHARGGRRLGGLVLGIIVVIVGVVWLGRNFGWWSGSFQNWWALFIFIPAVGFLGDAWREYISNGRRLGGNAARPLAIGILLAFVALMFLFDLDWAYFWPIVLILVGVGLLLGRWRRRER